jgi:hypothetical protein
MDSEFGVAAAFVAVGAAALLAQTANRREVTVIIHNQLQYTHLVSPVLYLDNGEIINVPAPGIAPRTGIAARFRRESINTEFSGALLYALQRPPSSPCQLYAFVAWQAESFDSTRVYAKLLLDYANVIVDVNRLKHIHQGLRHQFVRARDCSLMQSYPFQNGLGVSLQLECGGNRGQRELHLTVIDNIYPTCIDRPLWIGPRPTIQNPLRRTASRMAGRILETVAEAIGDPENLLQLFEFFVEGVDFLDAIS